MKQLHAYQAEGAEFLCNGGTLLADEPGLGKTLQAIEACKQLGAQRVLIVCPAVALAVWRDEINDCWPECTPIFLRELRANGPWPLVPQPFALITGYEFLVVNAAAREAVATLAGFDVLVCDEAHALKSPTAKRTMLIYGPGCAGGGVASLALKTILLTGTAQLNHPGEWFPHLRCLAPEKIHEKSYAGFTAKYCTVGRRPVRTKSGRTTWVETIEGANRDHTPDLAKRLRGFWLRRKAVDVLEQLPPMQTVVRALPPEACDTAILAKIQNSPEAALLKEALEAGDVDALRSIEGQVSRLRRLFALAKVSATIAWVEDLFDQGVDKVGVWGWHVDALSLLGEKLGKYGVVTITGATPATSRGDLVKKFQEGPAKVFIGQIQAAGTAITLTAASRAVFLEQAWTPALNHQAAKRHHRIGQTRPVLAEVLAVDGSIDQAVAAILARKASDIALLEESN